MSFGDRFRKAQQRATDGLAGLDDVLARLRVQLAEAEAFRGEVGARFRAELPSKGEHRVKIRDDGFVGFTMSTDPSPVSQLSAQIRGAQRLEYTLVVTWLNDQKHTLKIVLDLAGGQVSGTVALDGVVEAMKPSTLDTFVDGVLDVVADLLDAPVDGRWVP